MTLMHRSWEQLLDDGNVKTLQLVAFPYGEVRDETSQEEPPVGSETNKKRLPLRRGALMLAFRRAMRNLDRAEGVQLQEIAESISYDMEVAKESVLLRIDEIISMAINIKMVNEISPNCYTLKNPRMILCGVCGGKRKKLQLGGMSKHSNTGGCKYQRVTDSCKPKRRKEQATSSCGCNQKKSASSSSQTKTEKPDSEPDCKPKRKSCQSEKCKKRKIIDKKPSATKKPCPCPSN